MIVSGKSFSIREARLEGSVVQCIRDWATDHPDELVNLDQMVKGMRREGEFMGKDMAHLAEIPVTLYNRLVKLLGPSWMRDRQVANMVFSNFRVGLLNLNTRI